MSEASFSQSFPLKHTVEVSADWSAEWRQDRFLLQSPGWRGEPWHHEVLWVEGAGDAAILEVTGDNVADEDLVWARQLSQMSGMPAAILCQVPNQPIFDLAEDDLIAHSFVEYLRSGYEEWPLLIPMVRSVVAAMDMLQKERGIQKFIVTGASKRGWTTWLLAALNDPRVIGIAPRLFDNLNFPVQLARQIEAWGEPSEEIDPYVQRGLHQVLRTPAGERLLNLVDPWRMREAIQVPALIINGANDPFWMPDALSVYWGALSNPHACLVQPNVGHSLGDIRYWGPTLTAFAHACLAGELLPTPSLSLPGDMVVGECEGMSNWELWVADAQGMQFADANFECVGVSAGEPLGLPAPEVNQAILPIFNVKDFRLSLPIQIRQTILPQ